MITSTARRPADSKQLSLDLESLLLPEQLSFFARRLESPGAWCFGQALPTRSTLSRAQLQGLALTLLQANPGLCIQQGLVDGETPCAPLGNVELASLAVMPGEVAGELLSGTEQSRHAHAGRLFAQMAEPGSPKFGVGAGRTHDGRWWVVLVVHHFVCDGSSFQSLADQLLAALERPEGARLDIERPPSTLLEYLDYASSLREWAHSQDIAEVVDRLRSVAGRSEALVPQRTGHNRLEMEETHTALVSPPAMAVLLAAKPASMSLESMLTVSLWQVLSESRQPIRINVQRHGRFGPTCTGGPVDHVGWFSTAAPISVGHDRFPTTLPDRDHAAFEILRRLGPTSVRTDLARLDTSQIHLSIGYERAGNRLGGALDLQLPRSAGLRKYLLSVDVTLSARGGTLEVAYSAQQYDRTWIEDMTAEFIGRLERG